MHRVYIAVIALALAAFLHLGAVGGTPRSAYAECATAAEGRNVDSSYFAEMLMMLQQKPHPFAVKALMDWKPMEGTRACWNPLSTTMEAAHSDNFNCLNPPDCTMGVQDFADKRTGQQATSRTLALSFYQGLRNFLSGKSFDPDAIRQSIYTWGGDDAYADTMIERWQETWEERKPESLKPPTAVTVTNQGGDAIVRWGGSKQGQQAMTVWRWEGGAWARIARVGAGATEYTDREPRGQGAAYMVCTEGASDSACSDKATPVTRPAASASTATRVNVTSFPSRASRGSTVFIRAVSSPGAACSLSARPGAKAKASTEATADASGAVTWSWPVATDAKGGSFSVKLTCGAATATRTLVIE